MRPLRPCTRPTAALALAAAVVCFLLPATAGAAFTPAQLKCRSTVAKGGAKLTKTILKTIGTCHRDHDKSGQGLVDCNDITKADTKNRLPGLETKYAGSVGKACIEGAPSDVLYDACPPPCDADVPAIASFADLAACEACLTRSATQGYADTAYGNPHSPANDADVAACHATITKASAKLYNSVLKIVSKCQNKAEKGGATTTTQCASTDFDASVDTALQACKDAISARCTNDMLVSSFDACEGSATIFDLALCVCGGAKTSAQPLVDGYYSLESPGGTTTTTTTSTTTTTTLATQDPKCPDLGELVLFSRDSQIPCASNADCASVPPRTCDTTLGRCRTQASLDSGWTGLGHNADIDDGVRTRARLTCPGPAPTCGQCNVAGIDPEPRNCRCSNDTRTVCDQPFAADATHCGGATCDCYFGAPFPLVSGGTPACIVNRFAKDISGTANVDQGSGEISASLRTKVFLGITVPMPCPTCGGSCSLKPAIACSNDAECTGTCNGTSCSNSPSTACTVNADCEGGPTCNLDTPDDGVRGGVCLGGASAGLACDAMGINPSLPAEAGAAGGAMYSLDCLPDVGTNISGSGLQIALDQTTGTTSLAAQVACDGSGPGGSPNCPCLMCSGDTTVPCNADSDCAGQAGSCTGTSPVVACMGDADCTAANIGPCVSVGASKRCNKKKTVTCTTNTDCLGQDVSPCLPSSCSSFGNSSGTPPRPNQCDNEECQDMGGGVGRCATGPDDRYCDNIVTADGGGVFSCQIDDDCAPAQIGLDGGTCTLTRRRPCFLDPIVATGTPDPHYPVAVATFCVPPTSSSGINIVAGLPGPGRVRSQGGARTFCASDHGTEYQPGTGGCP